MLLILAAGCASAPTTPAPAPAAAPAPHAAAAPAARRPLVIAHRGFSWRAPEHTLAAYRLADSAGADLLEQDLQLTVDGRLLVLHDETGRRTLRGTSCDDSISARPAAHWLGCDAGSWFNAARPDRAAPAFAAERPMLLDDVLHAFPGRRFYVETKQPDAAPGMEDSLIAVLDRAGLRPREATSVATAPVVLQSFSRASLERLAALAPELPRVLLLDRRALPRNAARRDAALAEIARVAAGIGPNRRDVDAGLVAAAHRHCLVVHPYTVNDPREMRRLLDAGVDGLFTDRPDVLRQLADARTAPSLPPHCGR